MPESADNPPKEGTMSTPPVTTEAAPAQSRPGTVPMMFEATALPVAGV